MKDSQETNENEQEIKLTSQESDHTLEQLYYQIFEKIENKKEKTEENLQ